MTALNHFPASGKEKHDIICRRYLDKVPFYMRGDFKRFVRLVLFLVWCCVWTDSAIRYYSLDYVDFSFMNPRIYIIPVIILILGIWIFKPYRFFTDKTRCGVIENIARSQGYNARMSGGTRFGGKSVSARYTVPIKSSYTVTVRGIDGKKTVKKIPAFENFSRLYKEGSAVSVISGVALPIPLEDGIISKERCLCTSCGSFEPSDYKRCNMCHSLLWNK